MKIVYYLPSLYIPGGLERIITFKANYFADNIPNCSVTIITSEQIGKPPYFPLSSRVKHIDLGCPIDWPFNQSPFFKILKYPFRYYLFRKRLSSALFQIKADIVISTLRREINFIHSINDGSVKIGEFHITRNSYQANSIKQDNPFIRFIKKRLSDRFINNLEKLSRVILLTNEESLLWPELSNISVIPNPLTIHVSCVSPMTNKQVIAVGRYTKEKGFDRLIDSWTIVTQKHPDWILKIYGDGNREELQEQINNLSLRENCILEHTVNNITAKYCESSIFVLSSRYEGFGMVLVEAMACGVPPVSFACPCGPRDIIKDKEDGLLVENGNIEELADRICYLIENEEVRKRMGKQARINAERFKIEYIAKQWESLFNDLLKNKNNHELV